MMQPGHIALLTPLAVAALLSVLPVGPAGAAGAEPPLAERLGYKATDKLLIIHADDAGMCHSVNVATIRAMEQGVVTSASIMVPCPWFPEIAKYCREHPDADFGVHLTLTSEWKLFRWPPVARDVLGLFDTEGFLPHGVPDVLAKASPAEVEKEIRAQIARARAFGVQPTHVDSHMGTLFTPQYLDVYTKVARETGIVPMFPDLGQSRLAAAVKALGIDPAPICTRLRKAGFPLLDTLNTGEDGKTLEERRDNYYRFFRNLKPGVTQVIVHLSLDDEEMRSITGSWRARWHEYQIMTDPKTRDLLNELGIKLIGYRELNKLFQQ